MAGSISLALAQQVDVNGKPLAGCFLYTYVVGTVSTIQNTYQDFGLTIINPSPLEADQSGRIPMFYLADGQVHVRLTDANGVVIFDYPSIQVVGPSSGGGGGGGGSVDPSTIAATGDIKCRATTETLTGWVKLNGTTIGSATSGAAQRANADTQNLFVYLWQNFSNSHCPVAGGRGATALADFQSNLTIGLPDWRGRTPVGLDDMGSSAAGRLLASNVTSGGGDGVTTAGASGGEANHTLLLAEAPQGQFSLNDTTHLHTVGQSVGGQGSPSSGPATLSPNAQTTTLNTSAVATGVTITDNAGGGAHNNCQPFTLVSWYVHL